ncbi:MAG: gluconate 2-dehydrogenase subunit 3 family protein [Thermomicrobiales bacterium]
MAAIVVASAWDRDIRAQENNPALVGFEFFNASEAKTVDAVAEQYWPTTQDSPGGHDAGVVYYIDRSLAGAYQEFQQLYRDGITWLDQATSNQYGAAFAALSADQQLAFLSDTLGAPKSTTAGGTPVAATPSSATPVSATPEPANLGVEGAPLGAATPAAAANSEATAAGVPMLAGGDGPQAETLADFLDILRSHTMEGLFSDPVYGGNRGFAGWKAVNYPGPFYIKTKEQQQSFKALDLPFQSIADL